MRKSSLKKALQENKQTYGSWISLAHPVIPEILASAGFDWLVIDMEHSSIDLKDLVPIITAIEGKGCVPLVRVGENSPNLIKRVMDAGSYGVIVPNVNNAEEAQAAVAAVKYPPSGRRGVGLYRAQAYGREFEAYKKWLERESIIVVQIEHIKAVENIDEIFAVKGIDAFMIGPYDLSGSLGRPGDFKDKDVQVALKRVMEAAARHKIPAGYHSVSSDPAEAQRRRKEGYKFLAFSVDTIFLSDASHDALLKLKGKVA